MPRRFHDPTLSRCLADATTTANCPRATTLTVSARRRAPSPRYAHYIDNGEDNDDHHEEAVRAAPHIDVDRAANNILSYSRTARSVTQRLTDPTRHRKSLEKAQHDAAIPMRVPVRTDSERTRYVEKMLREGQERRRRELAKIHKEVDPSHKPRVSARTEQIVFEKRQKQQYVAIEDRYKMSRPSSSGGGATSKENATPQHHHHRRDDFKPAGGVPHHEDTFLCSRQTPRCPSPRPSQPLSDEQRKQRFIELSQPRVVHQ